MKKLLVTLALLAAISVIITIVLVFYDYLRSTELFPYRTFIGRVDVSGLDQIQAYEKLESLRADDVYSAVVTFEAGKIRYTFQPGDLGIYINLKSSVQSAFTQLRKKGYVTSLKERLAKESMYFPVIVGVNDKQLLEVITDLYAKTLSTAKDASIILDENTGGYHIESDDPGRTLRIVETVKEFHSTLAKGSSVFPLIFNYETPKITETMLRAHPPAFRLAAYTTYYGRHDSPNRIHNIKLIASWLDGTMLLPGEIFTLGDKIGDFTPERGFKEAFVIYNGELVPMLGGGTCQIATTLFNTATLADLEVIQRSSHSFYFNIYPLGRDAAVYPPAVDLKFKNDTPYPILIKALATNKRLSFRIYGTPTGKKVDFSPVKVFLLNPGVGYRPASVAEVLAADRPFRTEIVRRVYNSSGMIIKEETLKSYYKLYGEKTNVPIARPEPR
ncbi:MAG: VanW family protein [Candidatus Margulisbacteria bacterium]|nr:VanW family protein [Candidatus Margulisiibacteriota bacterium]MBU1616707.1 VanW family protein [Candidatus Margulisiibacteriota bacterium]MBU1867719.1 VanW family protein [Candidatus Margulisiibacteriota bacterium]